MARFLLRTIGFFLLAACFASLIVDGTRSIAGRHVLLFSFGETAQWLFPTWMAELTQHVDQAGWRDVRPLLTRFLDVPTWAVTGAVAVLLLLVGRRRPSAIGISGRRPIG